MRIRVFLTMAAACGVISAVHAATPTERTLPVDPVELAAGREVAGKPELSVVRDRIEYRFATAANKAEFEKSPTRYEVANGGACGKMGPLSGIGDARRYAAHEGRVYFFASDGCRKSFLKEPAKYIENDAPKPDVCPARLADGRAVMDKLVAWAGGEKSLANMRSYRETATRQEKSGGKTWNVSDILAARFPDRFVSRGAWNDDWFATIRDPDGVAMASELRHEIAAASQVRAFDRWLARSLPVMLKAYVDDKTGQANPELVVVSGGDGEINKTPVYFVTVWLQGAATRLAIEKSTGRPVQESFNGRDSTAAVGDVVRTFTEYKSVDGVRLPTAYSVMFEGKELPSAALALDSFEINPTLSADMFVVKK